MFHSRLKGRDLHSPSNEIVENNTGSTIPAMRVIRLDSQGTVYPQIALADPVTYPNFAITYDDIPNGKNGIACAFGFMIGVNTSPWAVGTSLYSDSNGNLSTFSNGGLVAQVLKQHATDGVLYVVTEPSASGSGAWGLTGNVGTDENSFIGTADNKDLKFKTNSQFGMVLTKQGRLGLGPEIKEPDSHFHQKSHVGYAGSGLKQETFALSTNSSTFQQSFTVTLPDPCVARIEYIVVGRSQDGSRRCMFKRTGLFYRQSGNARSEGIWLSDQTIKSHSTMDVSYTLTTTDVNFNVKAGELIQMYWTGHVIIEMLVNNT